MLEYLGKSISFIVIHDSTSVLPALYRASWPGVWEFLSLSSLSLLASRIVLDFV